MRKYNVGMSADVPRRGEDDGPRATAVTFRSVVEERPGQRLHDLFDLWWPAYRRWFLRDGAPQLLRARIRDMVASRPALN